MSRSRNLAYAHRLAMRTKLRKAHVASAEEHGQVKIIKTRLPHARPAAQEDEDDEIDGDLDPLIAAEDLEIKRLEKLLGIGKSKSISLFCIL